MFVVKAYLPVNESFGKYCEFTVEQTTWCTCSVNCKHAVDGVVNKLLQHRSKILRRQSACARTLI